MDTQRTEVRSSPNNPQRKLRNLFPLLIAAVVAATSVGCASTQPHVTAKVIFQDESGVSAEVATEWR